MKLPPRMETEAKVLLFPKSQLTVDKIPFRPKEIKESDTISKVGNVQLHLLNRKKQSLLERIQYLKKAYLRIVTLENEKGKIMRELISCTKEEEQLELTLRTLR